MESHAHAMPMQCSCNAHAMPIRGVTCPMPMCPYALNEVILLYNKHSFKNRTPFKNQYLIFCRRSEVYPIYHEDALCDM